MQMNRSLARALILLAVIATVQMVLQLPYLPSPFAVQFSLHGEVTRWGTPHEFVILNLVVMASILGVSLVLPGFLGKRPSMRWNLPNREYWLAPERVAKTVDYVKRMMLWIGVMTLLLLMALFQIVVDANTRQPPNVEASRTIIVIGGFVVFMVLWALAFWRRFSRLPPDRGENPFG